MSLLTKKISVSSLDSPNYVGWMTKQGGSWKSWKRRWFVLKGNYIYYFKGQKDTEVTGVIYLTQDSFVRKETDKKRKNKFAIGTPSRIYFMYPDTENEQDEWIKQIQQIIDSIKTAGKPKKSVSKVNDEPHGQSSPTNPSSTSVGVRHLLQQAKSEIAFLDAQDSKVLEFWQIWSESIPPRKDIDQGVILFEVGISGDMEKLTWKASGPQYCFIQKMVDFFWNVGAPETEIDRLNGVGAMINPSRIGSWIDMSAKGGMDGGWFFPVEVSLKNASEAADPGDPMSRVISWAERNGITKCMCLGRDMGAAPPRQTEIRFEIASEGSQKLLDRAINAYGEFGFPPIPDEAIDIVKSISPKKFVMSIITSSDGFVRLGLLTPDPPKSTVESLCNLSGGNSEQLARFERSIGVTGPEYVEFYHLMEGFGYAVYKEGFDIIFHYKIGEEGPM